MDYLLHKANGTDTAELNKQVGGFSAISSVLVKLNHNKVGEMELKLSAPALYDCHWRLGGGKGQAVLLSE